jgi:hypothetical protein
MTTTSFSSIVISQQWQERLRRWFNFHRVLWALTLVCFFCLEPGAVFTVWPACPAGGVPFGFLPDARRQLRHIRVSRQIMDDFTAGLQGSITYYLQTRWASYDVELIEALEFVKQKEPHFFFKKISGQTTCKLQFTCLQRGCFRLCDIQLSSAYLFGVEQEHRRFPQANLVATFRLDSDPNLLEL